MRRVKERRTELWVLCAMGFLSFFFLAYCFWKSGNVIPLYVGLLFFLAGCFAFSKAILPAERLQKGLNKEAEFQEKHPLLWMVLFLLSVGSVLYQIVMKVLF